MCIITYGQIIIIVNVIVIMLLSQVPFLRHAFLLFLMSDYVRKYYLKMLLSESPIWTLRSLSESPVWLIMLIRIPYMANHVPVRIPYMLIMPIRIPCMASQTPVRISCMAIQTSVRIPLYTTPPPHKASHGQAGTL